MNTQIMVSMNGVSLASLDSRIVLQSVREQKPARKYDTVQTGGRIGQLVTGFERTELAVDVQFAIAEIHDRAARVQILQKVNAWAAMGGILTASYRSGQQLNVLCDTLAAVGYVREWEKSYTLTLKAWGVPYWESSSMTTVPVSRSTTSVTVNNPGTADAPLEIDCVGMQTFGGISVTDAKGNKLVFSIPNADAVTSYDAASAFSVTHDGAIMVGSYTHTVSGTATTTDALKYRTTASADELWLHPGDNVLTVAVNGAAYGTDESYLRIGCRGRWV